MSQHTPSATTGQDTTVTGRPVQELPAYGPNLQREIYTNGLQGKKPVLPTTYQEMDELARSKLPQTAYNYLCGGAGQERTMTANTRAFEDIQLVPSMLKNVAERNQQIKLFGKRLPSPLLLAPIGALSLAHPEADLAVARAAASEGVPMIFSNQASFSMETCAGQMGNAPRWFQLYWSKSRDLVKSLVQRAEKAGCQAVVVTVDTTLLGWRNRDLDQGYLPFMQGKGIAQYTSDPVFRELIKDKSLTASNEQTKVNLNAVMNLGRMAQHYPAPFLEGLKSGEALAAVRLFARIYSNPALNWDDLAFLRECTSLPILIKGVQSVQDARQALDYGVDGIVVSNHGGRQVDGAIGSLHALNRIKKALGSRVPLLFDSGIRNGADVVKALAVGADAVCVGRPYALALALKGETGVRQLIRYYKAEIDLTMGLAGCRSIAELPNTLEDV